MPYDELARAAGRIRSDHGRLIAQLSKLPGSFLRPNPELQQFAAAGLSRINAMVEPFGGAALAGLRVSGVTASAVAGLSNLASVFSEVSLLQLAEPYRFNDIAKIQGEANRLRLCGADWDLYWRRPLSRLPDMSKILGDYRMPDLSSIGVIDRTVLSLSFERLTHAYDAAVACPVLADLPAFADYRIHDVALESQVEFLDVVAVRPSKRVDASPFDLRDSVVTRVEDQLARTWPRLARRLVAARKALESNNPERTQHCAVSLRRLLLTLIDVLADSDQTRAWAAKIGREDLFVKGKVTRRARLLYIVGWQGGTDLYSGLLEQNVNMLLAGLNVLQSELHDEPEDEETAVVLTGDRGRVALLSMASGLETLLTASRFRRES